MPAGYGITKHAKDLAKLNRNNVKNRGNFQRTYKNKFPTTDLKFNNATPEELEQFRTEFLRKKRKRNIRTALLTTLFFVVIAITIWIISI